MEIIDDIDVHESLTQINSSKLEWTLYNFPHKLTHFAKQSSSSSSARRPPARNASTTLSPRLNVAKNKIEIDPNIKYSSSNGIVEMEDPLKMNYIYSLPFSLQGVDDLRLKLYPSGI